MNSNSCPVCGEEAFSTCKCPRSDSVCKNGHKWYYCTVHKKKMIGSSDHSIPTGTCTCIVPATNFPIQAQEADKMRGEPLIQINGIATYAVVDWPEDKDMENGNYLCICSSCDITFIGHKRRKLCKVCASKRGGDGL